MNAFTMGISMELKLDQFEPGSVISHPPLISYSNCTPLSGLCMRNICPYKMVYIYILILAYLIPKPLQIIAMIRLLFKKEIIRIQEIKQALQ